MEWLINRRRMMYNKAVPAVYLNFEDNYVKDVCSYFWGDTEALTSGEYKSGTFQGNGATAVETSPIFAENRAIPAHLAGNRTNVSAKSARTVSYRLYLTVENAVDTSTIWDADSVTTDANSIFNVSYWASGSDVSSWTPIKYVTRANWASEKSENTVIGFDSETNKYYVDFTAPNNCRYLRIFVRADSNVTINWSLTVTSGTVYIPIGITEKQCKHSSVATLFSNSKSYIFSSNPFISSFKEFVYFTGIKTFPSYAFNTSGLSVFYLPKSATGTSGGQAFESRSNNSTIVILLPASRFTMWDNNICRYRNVIFISLSTVPPSILSNGNTLKHTNYITIYAPDENITDYQNSSWGTQTNRYGGATVIKGLSELTTTLQGYYDYYIQYQ